jgi:hypothetical protein
MDLCNKPQFQMDIPTITESFLLLSSRHIPMLRLLDKLPLINNKLLMSGETDGLITPVLSLTHTVFTKLEPTQMVTPSTTVFFLLPSSRPTLMPKPLEPLLLPLNKNLMHGETDSLPTLDQLLTTPKSQQFQMDIPSTMVSFLIPSKRLTPTLRPRELPPLMLNKNPMPGEKDSLPTLDQSSTMPNSKTCWLLTQGSKKWTTFLNMVKSWLLTQDSKRWTTSPNIKTCWLLTQDSNKWIISPNTDKFWLPTQDSNN